ncbi:MAG TPA: PIN domain-containing protein, partial [Sphaerochaeta sp.]|nr:PIN domain-containing protein [Sphaerochaeta sp.]
CLVSIPTAQVEKIIGFCITHSIPANQLDLVQALTDFLHGGVDFNDAILIDVCRKRNIKLMTNDGDFQSGGIEVITSNQRLLQACP